MHILDQDVNHESKRYKLIMKSFTADYKCPFGIIMMLGKKMTKKIPLLLQAAQLSIF